MFTLSSIATCLFFYFLYDTYNKTNKIYEYNLLLQEKLTSLELEMIIFNNTYGKNIYPYLMINNVKPSAPDLKLIENNENNVKIIEYKSIDNLDL